MTSLRALPMPDLLDQRQAIALDPSSIDVAANGYTEAARKRLRALDREIKRRVFARDEEAET